MSNLANESSGIIAISSGAVADMKGAWVQAIASTIRLSEWLAIFECGSVLDTNTGKRHFLDIGVGAAGSEVVRHCNLTQACDQLIMVNMGEMWSGYSMPIKFASGLRLSFRIADERAFVHDYSVEMRLFEKPI